MPCEQNDENKGYQWGECPTLEHRVNLLGIILVGYRINQKERSWLWSRTKKLTTKKIIFSIRQSDENHFSISSLQKIKLKRLRICIKSKLKIFLKFSREKGNKRRKILWTASLPPAIWTISLWSIPSSSILLLSIHGLLWSRVPWTLSPTLSPRKIPLSKWYQR